MKHRKLVPIYCVLFLLISCGVNKNDYATVNRYGNSTRNRKYTGYYKVGEPYTVLGQTYHPKKEEKYEEIGIASWYGKEFYGKKTANGEIYNMHDITGAHRTLPLPSIVRVTNLENGKSIKVRINDRGPFTKNRIIDLSKESAKKLGFDEQGTAQVKVELLPEETKEMLERFGLKQ